MTKINNIFCDYIYLGNNNYICSKCKMKITISDQNTEPPIFPCSSLFIEQKIEEIKDLASSTVDNVILCEDTEVSRRLGICKSCEFYSNNTCSKCGCILMNTTVFAGKLTQKDSTCPIEKW